MPEFLMWCGFAYLAIGLIWTLIFTGILLFKAIKKKEWDCVTVVVLIICFFISWTLWPISIKNNLRYLIF